MNYHLHDGGKDLGVFPLEELRRQRDNGQLTGRELVWCQGMSDWQPLDSIIRPDAGKKSTALLVTAIAGGALVIILGAVGLGLVALKSARRLQLEASGREPSTAASGNPKNPALEIASAPIVWNSHTLTTADVRKKKKEFRDRQYVENYKKFGRHDSPDDADALRLINSWIVTSYGTPEDQKNIPSLQDLGDKLASKADCDPLVLTAAAASSVELHEALKRFERAVDGFQNSKYPGYPKFYASVSLSDKLFNDQLNRQPVLDASALEYLQQALSDGSVRPEDQDELADVLVMGWGQKFFYRNGAAVYPAVQKFGKPFEWLGLVLQGEFEIQEAWKARGDNYASDVSPQGWKGFYEHLAKARIYLTQAWKLRPEFPLAAERMMSVSLGTSGLQEMRLWFDRAVAAELDYPEAWNEFRWGLRPRWGGNIDAMLAFGVAAVKTKRFDTDAPGNFYRSLKDIESELETPPGEHIYGREDIWPYFQEMYEGYIADPHAPGTQNGWRANYATVAFLAKKYSVARTQLEALDWKAGDVSLSGYHTDLSLLPFEVAARTGPLAAQITKAEAARRNSDFSGAYQIYQELSRGASPDERTAAFIRDRLKTVDVERRLRAGEWVDLMPTDKDLTGWVVERGHCQLLPDGSLQVQSDENGHILYSRARFGKHFEVKGEIETVSSSTRAFQGGLVIGLPEFDTWDWDAFRLKRNDDEGEITAFSEGWSRNQVYRPVKLNDQTNSFYLRFDLDRITASVNGQEIFNGVKAPENWRLTTNEMHLGLGAFNDMNKSTMRYRNVQVHQLPGN